MRMKRSLPFAGEDFLSRNSGRFISVVIFIVVTGNRLQAETISTMDSSIFGARASQDQGGYKDLMPYSRDVSYDAYAASSLSTVNYRALRVSEVLLDNRLAYRASFDCDRSYSSVTNTICSTPLLSRLDYQLALTFARLDNKLDDRQNRVIHHGETRFLNLRQTCDDTACLKRLYARRLEELNDIRIE